MHMALQGVLYTQNFIWKKNIHLKGILQHKICKKGYFHFGLNGFKCYHGYTNEVNVTYLYSI